MTKPCLRWTLVNAQVRKGIDFDAQKPFYTQVAKPSTFNRMIYKSPEQLLWDAIHAYVASRPYHPLPPLVDSGARGSDFRDFRLLRL
jgi:hypothetical protein